MNIPDTSSLTLPPVFTKAELARLGQQVARGAELMAQAIARLRPEDLGDINAIVAAVAKASGQAPPQVSFANLVLDPCARGADCHWAPPPRKKRHRNSAQRPTKTKAEIGGIDQRGLR